MAQTHENSAAAHAMAPASVDEKANFVNAEVGRRACALNKSVLTVNGILSVSFILVVKIGQKLRSLEIIDCTDFDAIRALRTEPPTHTRTYAHADSK